MLLFQVAEPCSLAAVFLPRVEVARFEVVKKQTRGDRVDGVGAYEKDAGPHRGTVFVVNGTGGNVAGADFGLDHPAIFTSHSVLGSMILEVEGDRLDARFIDTSGAALDWFTIFKSQPTFRDGFESGDTGAWSGTLP